MKVRRHFCWLLGHGPWLTIDSDGDGELLLVECLHCREVDIRFLPIPSPSPSCTPSAPPRSSPDRP